MWTCSVYVRTGYVRSYASASTFQSLSKFSGRLEQENFGFSRQKKIWTVGTLLHHFTNLNNLITNYCLKNDSVLQLGKKYKNKTLYWHVFTETLAKFKKKNGELSPTLHIFCALYLNAADVSAYW